MTDLIDAYAQRLRAAGASVETIKTRCRALRHAHKTLPHGLIHACGDEIVAYLATKQAAWTRHTYYYALRGYYSTMVKASRLTYDPMQTVDVPRSGESMPNPVTDEELAHALERSPSEPWKAAIILGAYAGLRCGELCRITCADISRDRVRVIRGKGGKDRYIPTHPLVWQLREDVQMGHLVVDRQGNPFTTARLSCNQRRHWQRIGLGPDMHMHRFRHWFGTALVDQGVGIDVVRELMGHASIATTQGYVRVSAARKAAAILTLPRMKHEPDGSRLVPPTASAA